MYSFYALSVMAVLLCGLLAWAGFELEINKGSGSVPYASTWAAGTVSFGLTCAVAFGYMARSINEIASKHNKILLILSCIVGAVFAVFLLQISRNVSVTSFVMLPVSALVLGLPIIAYFTAWKSP